MAGRRGEAEKAELADAEIRVDGVAFVALGMLSLVYVRSFVVGASH